MSSHLPPSEMSPADYVLIHGVTALAVQFMRDDNTELVLSCLREALPRVTRTIPMVAAFASVAEELVAPAVTRPALAQHHAMGPAHRFHMLRLAEAHDAMRKTPKTRAA